MKMENSWFKVELSRQTIGVMSNIYMFIWKYYILYQHSNDSPRFKGGKKCFSTQDCNIKFDGRELRETKRPKYDEICLFPHFKRLNLAKIK